MNDILFKTLYDLIIPFELYLIIKTYSCEDLIEKPSIRRFHNTIMKQMSHTRLKTLKEQDYNQWGFYQTYYPEAYKYDFYNPLHIKEIEDDKAWYDAMSIDPLLF